MGAAVVTVLVIEASVMVTCRLLSARLVDSNQRHVLPQWLFIHWLCRLRDSTRQFRLSLVPAPKTLKLAALDPAWLRQQATERSDREIGLELGVTQATIRYHRRKHGIPSYTELTGNMKVHATGEARRRGTHSSASSEALDVGYFTEIDVPEKAYWIGVLATDGCVSENSRISLSQTVDDGELVDSFAAAVGGQMFLRTREVTHEGFLGEGKTRRVRCVRFTSRQMGRDLAAQGIVPRKTKLLRVSPCADRFPAAYLRGCLDGDGTVGKLNFKFSSGSEAWIDEAQELIELHTGRTLRKYRQASSYTGGVVFVLQGVRGDQPVLEWIYSKEGGPMRMERKFLRFSRYWLNRESSWWKDKAGARALVEALPAGLASASSR
jgi:hypothetical protein